VARAALGPGADLTVDFAFFPAPAATVGARRKLLVLTSGVHGIEGFTGSMLQALFLERWLAPTLARGVSVLLVHGLNPYGFQTRTRYAESRVDLNRNFFAADAFPVGLDDRVYDEFATMLAPSGAAAFGTGDLWRFLGGELFPRRAAAFDGTLTRAAGQGQYRYPAGLIYGGKAAEPQRAIFLAAAAPQLAAHDDVMLLDLHTGLGRRELQLLPNPPYSPAAAALREQLFRGDGLAVEETGTAAFYASYGDFSDFVCAYADAHHPEHRCANMLLEYGTLIQPCWRRWPLGLGGLRASLAQAFTLYLAVRENQAFHHGVRTPAEAVALTTAYRDLFYPTDPAWRRMVVAETLAKWPVMLDRFAGL
jgi:hypothetical protein